MDCVYFLLHEKLVGFVEFDIIHRTYNIKIRNYQSARCHVPEGCNLHVHDVNADHQ